jgi:hypothetical protein
LNQRISAGPLSKEPGPAAVCVVFPQPATGRVAIPYFNLNSDLILHSDPIPQFDPILHLGPVTPFDPIPHFRPVPRFDSILLRLDAASDPDCGSGRGPGSGSGLDVDPDLEPDPDPDPEPRPPIPLLITNPLVAALITCSAIFPQRFPYRFTYLLCDPDVSRRVHDLLVH